MRYVMVKQVQCDENGNPLSGFCFIRYGIIDKESKNHTIFSGRNIDNCIMKLKDLNERDAKKKAAKETRDARVEAVSE